MTHVVASDLARRVRQAIGILRRRRQQQQARRFDRVACHAHPARFAVYDIDANVRARAKEICLGHVVDDPADAVRDADLVILAVPVGAMGAAYISIAAAMKPGAILSDVGSVKRAVVAAIAPRADIFFVPAHPLAGAV